MAALTQVFIACTSQGTGGTGGWAASVRAERRVNKLLTGYVSSSNLPAIHSCGNLSTTINCYHSSVV